MDEAVAWSEALLPNPMPRPSKRSKSGPFYEMADLR